MIGGGWRLSASAPQQSPALIVKRTSWGTATLRDGSIAVLMLLTLGCGADPSPEGGTTQEEPDSVLPESSSENLAEVASRATPRRPPINPGGFAHEAHRDVGCVTCHQAVEGHGIHQETGCTECHETPAAYATSAILGDDDCMACHHDAATGLECGLCHDGGAEQVLAIAQPLRFSMREMPVTRELPLDHARHEDVECGECHSAPVTYAMEGQCADCHQEHHRPEAECLACHGPSSREEHKVSVHRGCGGQGCHEDEVVSALPPSRTVCLECHEEQLEHEVDEDCISCHPVGEWMDRAGYTNERDQ